MRKKSSVYLRYGTCLLMVSLFLVIFLLFCDYFNVCGGGRGSGDAPGGSGDSPHLLRGEEEKEPAGINKKNEPGAIVARKKMLLGIHNEKIAVFEEDRSGNKILIEVLPYNVKNVYYEELIQGVPFYSEEEKMKLLENYTS